MVSMSRAIADPNKRNTNPESNSQIRPVQSSDMKAWEINQESLLYFQNNLHNWHIICHQNITSILKWMIHIRDLWRYGHITPDFFIFRLAHGCKSGQYGQKSWDILYHKVSNERYGYPLSIGTLLSNSGQTLLSKPAKLGSFWWFSGFLSVAEIFSQTIFLKQHN